MIDLVKIRKGHKYGGPVHYSDGPHGHGAHQFHGLVWSSIQGFGAVWNMLTRKPKRCWIDWADGISLTTLTTISPDGDDNVILARG